MASMNKVILLGNLTRDPELRYTPKGSAVAKFGLAMNRVWTTDTGEKREEVVFVDVDCWGKTAENVAQYLKKGRQAMVEGRLKLDQWEDKQTHQKKSRLGVVCERVLFLGGAPEGAAPKGQGAETPPRTAQPAPEPSDNDGALPDEGDDVPF